MGKIKKDSRGFEYEISELNIKEIKIQYPYLQGLTATNFFHHKILSNKDKFLLLRKSSKDVVRIGGSLAGKREQWLHFKLKDNTCYDSNFIAQNIADTLNYLGKNAIKNVIQIIIITEIIWDDGHTENSLLVCNIKDSERYLIRQYATS